MLTILYFVFFWTSSASVNIHSSSLYSRLITFINHNHSELNLHKAKSVNELYYTLYTVLLDDNFFILAGPWYHMILDSGCLYLYKHSGGDNYAEVFPLTNYRYTMYLKAYLVR